MGSPPNCRPECVVNTDCPSHLACITEKCRDPCPGSCGFNADCRVQNHIPICSCPPDYTGDSFTECVKTPPSKQDVPIDPCNPSPCGQNTECNNGICTCIPLYQGDPYTGCRPECSLNTDCSPNRACINLRCIDPCPGTCGQSALCDVINHIPVCTCPRGLEGDPFTMCREKKIGMLFSFSYFRVFSKYKQKTNMYKRINVVADLHYVIVNSKSKECILDTSISLLYF